MAERRGDRPGRADGRREPGLREAPVHAVRRRPVPAHAPAHGGVVAARPDGHARRSRGGAERARRPRERVVDGGREPDRDAARAAHRGRARDRRSARSRRARRRLPGDRAARGGRADAGRRRGGRERPPVPAGAGRDGRARRGGPAFFFYCFGDLLDQHLVAGIGTIYTAESLFAEHVYPWTPVRDVEDLEGLLLTARTLMQRTVRHGFDPRAGVVRHVHGRTRKACHVCGTPVAEGTANEPPYDRPIFWCPTCQAPPAAG